MKVVNLLLISFNHAFLYVINFLKKGRLGFCVDYQLSRKIVYIYLGFFALSSYQQVTLQKLLLLVINKNKLDLYIYYKIRWKILKSINHY